jgi:hypothetical protein
VERHRCGGQQRHQDAPRLRLQRHRARARHEARGDHERRRADARLPRPLLLDAGREPGRPPRPRRQGPLQPQHRAAGALRAPVRADLHRQLGGARRPAPDRHVHPATVRGIGIWDVRRPRFEREANWLARTVESVRASMAGR